MYRKVTRRKRRKYSVSTFKQLRSTDRDFTLSHHHHVTERHPVDRHSDCFPGSIFVTALGADHHQPLYRAGQKLLHFPIRSVYFSTYSQCHSTCAKPYETELAQTTAFRWNYPRIDELFHEQEDLACVMLGTTMSVPWRVSAAGFILSPPATRFRFHTHHSCSARTVTSS